MLKRLELKVPPVGLMFVTAAMMWAVTRSVPGLGVSAPFSRTFAAAFAFAGAVVSLLGVAAFKRAQTTVNPMKPDASSSLVVSGIYRHTRNPMYVGFALLLMAWAAFLSNALAVAFLPGFVAYMTRFQIVPEETALESRFGRDFVDYARRVRRWI